MAHRPFLQEKSHYRPQKYAHFIQESLSQWIPGDLRDPRLQDIGFITITAVEVSTDLKNAKIHFSLMGQNQKSKHIEAALNKAAPYLRRKLMEALHSKVTPQLHFHFDNRFEKTSRVHQLLTEISVESSTSPSQHEKQQDAQQEPNDF